MDARMGFVGGRRGGARGMSVGGGCGEEGEIGVVVGCVGEESGGWD